MSLFNIIVKPHPLAPFLLRAINWAQPDDPEKKYPLLGRIRYAWVSEDYKHIKIMLRDGETSWSEQKEGILKQIKEHETFVSLEEWETDKTFIIATFSPVFETSYDRDFPIKDFIEMLPELDQVALEKGKVLLIKHPGDLYNEALKDLENGKMSEEVKNLSESFGAVLNQVQAEEELKEITKENGISGNFNESRVIEIKQDGTIKED